ncbi:MULTISPECIES: hypothetical protein [unclassified Leptolyngbya]|uniref:hypothetical protein n=1 Tax=unclassified Leptolyngbya TaxID=2650499 RepID=UPI0016860BBF|nr:MULTISPECIES: hypothetical protein [unclassified Leptolyngbya]MBD1913071.1 hypothetical protein [Leptolyngbya sp. FACHB-8]MBD2154428.1 hypothetical protein [Leptolyngbya sp. FACHB-16]
MFFLARSLQWLFLALQMDVFSYLYQNREPLFLRCDEKQQFWILVLESCEMWVLLVSNSTSNSQYGHQSQEFTPYGRELLALMPENRAPLACGFRA